MTDFHYILSGIILTTVIMVVMLLMFAWGMNSTAKDCNRYGFFTHSGKVYDCKLREGQR